MKKLFMLLAVIISLINLNAQVNPPQKVVTNITNPLVHIKADSIQSKMIRFSTTMFGGMEQRIAPNADMNFSVRYNTNPNTVTICNAEIVIKKSGLCHFECFIASKVFGPNARIHPLINVNMKVNNDIYSLLSDKIMPLAQIADEKNSYYYSELFSLDIYTRGWFTGYLKEE